MPATLLTNVTSLIENGAVSATAVLPTFAAGSNRLVFVTGYWYNGGGNSSVAPPITAGGETALFVSGGLTGTPTNRVAIATYMFTESQIAAINGATLSSSGGSGSTKSLEYCVVQDAAQTAPSNVNWAEQSSGTITLPLTRSADSLTLARAYCSSTGTVLTFTNPAGTGNIFTASRRATFANSVDSAGTSNFTSSTSGLYTHALVFNVEPFGANAITDVNGGDGVEAGSTGNTFTCTSTYVPTSGTHGGKAISALSGSSGSYTFTSAMYVDGATFPEPNSSQTFSVTDGGTPITIASDYLVPVDHVGVELASADYTNPKNITYYTPTHADGDFIVHPSEGDDLVFAADGSGTALTAGLRVLWHWNSSTQVMTQLNVTINEAGEVTSVNCLTSAGLTTTGLTTSGSTHRGL